MTIVLQMFAQGEQQVDLIDFAGRWRASVISHSLDFVGGKAIGLKVGKAPIRVTKIWALGCRSSISVNGILSFADGFQRVSAQ